MDFTRAELRSLHHRSSFAGICLFVFDLVAFLLFSIFSLVDVMAFRVASSLAAGLFTALLFVVGHDACHQALTPKRWLNRFIGTLAFLTVIACL